MRRFAFILFLLLLALSGYFFIIKGEKFELSGDVSVQQDSLNVLCISVDFTLNRPGRAIIKYWNNEENVFYSNISPPGINHTLEVVGLQEESTYQFEIFATKKKRKHKAGAFSFTTQKWPRDLVALRWLKPPDNAYSGYILTQRRLAKGSVFLIDHTGEIVWYHKLPKQPKVSHWTKRGTILVLYGEMYHRNSAGDHIVEYDLFGNEQLHIDLNGLDQPLESHHEVLDLGDKRLLLLVYKEKEVDLSEMGGESDQVVLGDAIVIVDREGKIMWEWSVFDHTDPLQDTAILKTAEDWSHANSVGIDSDGNYLISFRNWNQVWKIDASDGRIIWKLGKGGDIRMKEEAYFSSQHAFHVNSKGEYMLFDNGTEHRQTRILTFEIDEEDKTAELHLNLPLPEELYADKMGNAVLIEDEKILVCSPRSTSIVVLDLQGSILSHMKMGIPDPYRAEYVPSLYPGHNGQEFGPFK